MPGDDARGRCLPANFQRPLVVAMAIRRRIQLRWHVMPCRCDMPPGCHILHAKRTRQNRFKIIRESVGFVEFRVKGQVNFRHAVRRATAIDELRQARRWCFHSRTA